MSGFLFTDAAEPVATIAPSSVARVAMERGIDKQLDYRVPAGLRASIKVGQRVRVPLGRGDRLAFGYVVELLDFSDRPKLKSLAEITDPRALVSPQLMQLAVWIGRYYVAPLGVVLESMIPSAVKKRIGGRSVRIVTARKTPEQLHELLEATKPKKRRSLIGRLLQLGAGESIELVRLAGEAGVKTPAVVALAKLGVVSIESKEVFDDPLEFTSDSIVGLGKHDPTRDQQRVIDTIAPTLAGGFRVHLVRGVTGSGKTEVYLRLIDAVVRAGRGAIVLVPEIALTPQTVRRFTERFGRVAVMHSGLAAGERYRQWMLAAAGKADVIVGARSAVFAPHPRLGLIVVDEEHEPSYKQDSAPRYHGRDVAIKRAQLEAVPVLLGSATPSLEMWAKARDEGQEARDEPSAQSQAEAGASHEQPVAANAALRAPARPTSPVPRPYCLHELPVRVSDRPLPEVEIVDLKEASKFRKGIHLLSPRLEHLLKHTIERGQQAILLLNRRGYSNYIWCGSCQTALQCKFCDKTLTYHRSIDVKPVNRTTEAARSAGQTHCHYCLAVNTLPAVCPTCGKKLSLFGLGTQRVEEELAAKFPQISYARVDSDTMRSGRDYEALLSRFGAGELQVMLGTQMLAKGLDFPNVTLVGVVNGDTALNLPDFRAAERTFQLLTQVAGRAGRGELPGRVVIQTFMPEDETIRLAVSQDYVSFAARELEQRRSVGLPPYSRQARIVLRDQDEEKLHARAEQLSADVVTTVETRQLPVRVRGPMPPPVGRIAGHHRIQILLQSPSAAAIQRLMASLREHKHLVSGDKVAIDIDPIALL